MKNNTPFNVLKHLNQWEVAPKEPATVAAVGNFVLGAIGITGASTATATIVGYVTIAVVSSALTARRCHISIARFKPRRSKQFRNIASKY